MKRPLVTFALVFCLGIFFASRIKISFPMVYIFTLICLLFSFLCIKRGLRFTAFFCGLAFLFGAALLKNAQELPKCHIARFVSYKKGYLYTVKGIIDNLPLYKNRRTSFIFKTQGIQFSNARYKTCGSILVHIKGNKDLDYGEVLILCGNLYRPFSLRSRNPQSYRDYLYSQGVFALMQVETNCLVRLNENKGRIFKRLAFGLKTRMQSIISRCLSPVAASILEAMVLGEKRNISPIIYKSMIKSGTVHILVVSGFNVGLVAFMIILFLKLMRIPRKLRFCVATPLLIIYCLMTGASTPVVRATVMAIVFMFAYFIQREPDIYNSCAVAALFILGVNPRQLFDVGFQLSFISVISIVYLYPKIKAILHTDNIKRRYIRLTIEGCLVSFSAWLGTMGFIAYYFRIISPITVCANVFIVPLASLLTLCGFSLIAMELACPMFAPFFASSAELIVALLLSINAFLTGLVGAYFPLS